MILIINSAGVRSNKVQLHSKYLPFSSSVVVGILREASHQVVHKDLRNLVSPNLSKQLDDDDFIEYLKNNTTSSVMKEYLDLSLSVLGDINKYKIIGFSIFAHINFAYGLALAKHIKNKFPYIKIIFGGAFITIKELELPIFVDMFLKGNAKKPLLSIVEFILQNKEIDETLSGLYYRKDSGEIINNIQNREKAEEESLPDYSDLNLEYYIRPNKHIGLLEKVLHIPYRSSLGCNLACSFCTGRLVDRLSVKSNEKVMKEIKALSNLYPNFVLEFWDSSFNAFPEQLKYLLTRIIDEKLNIRYITEANIKGMDFELLKLLKDSGCRYVLWGLEGASEKMIKVYRKQYAPEKAYEIIKKSSELGIVNDVGFIYNGPGEDEKDVEAIIDFAKKFIFDDNVIMTFNDFYLEENSIVDRKPKKFGIKILSRPQKDKFVFRERILFAEDGLSLNELNAKKEKHSELIDRLKSKILAAKIINKINKKIGFILVPRIELSIILIQLLKKILKK